MRPRLLLNNTDCSASMSIRTTPIVYHSNRTIISAIYFSKRQIYDFRGLSALLRQFMTIMGERIEALGMADIGLQSGFGQNILGYAHERVSEAV